jgi:hypothetical protein
MGAPAQEAAASNKISRDVEEASSFSFLPYVDQSEMFDNVYSHLGRGGTIGKSFPIHNI